MPPQDQETARWFESEVQPHEPELRGFLRRMTGPEHIDDVVQETYFRLLRTRGTGQIRLPRALLFTIARNAAYDVFRRERTRNAKEVTDFETLRVLDNVPNAAEVACTRQETAILEAAIESLPERCRAVLNLRRNEQLSHKEIAAELSISVHTVKAHLTYALQLCAKHFARNGLIPRKPARPSE